jgi:hypothetical protein
MGFHGLLQGYLYLLTYLLREIDLAKDREQWGCCEHGNEALCYIKHWIILEYEESSLLGRGTV